MTTAGASQPAVSAKLPLAVDLDGTLFHGDLFNEAMLRFVVNAPWKLPVLLFWLMRGRAFAKAKLAQHAPCDPTLLPYDERLLAWLREERAQGRIIALATASDQNDAQRIADHLGIFDAVFASNGKTNLKSHRKAEALKAAYPQGFVYAGNEGADLKVWPVAREAVIVNASPSLTRRAQRNFAVEKIIPASDNEARAFLQALRPQQWAKNILVFLPMLVGQAWLEPTRWQSLSAAFIAFAALCCAASAVYLCNDLADMDADRRHPRKRLRAIARGALRAPVALIGAITLFSAGLALGARAQIAELIALYVIAASVYSFWFKRLVLADVFVLAGLYTLRVVIGGAATQHYASGWLLAFCCFFFFSVALVKRAAELKGSNAIGDDLNRRGYALSDASMVQIMGVVSSFIATLVLALYLQNDSATAHYGEPFLLWGAPAAILFWLCRIWLITDRGGMDDDPLVFAIGDKVSWLLFSIAAFSFLAAVLAPSNLLAW